MVYYEISFKFTTAHAAFIDRGPATVRMAISTSCTPSTSTTPRLPPASDTPRVAESQVWPHFQYIGDNSIELKIYFHYHERFWLLEKDLMKKYSKVFGSFNI